ncbi:MAG: 5'(3')-deoxyribonucleotidase [Microscillaceae bacterium]|nr:5'(3')-deoxyribonucleotidase [Microscillaceae bacterium]
MKYRIAVDMDEVVADSLSRYLLWYERDFEEKFPIDLLPGKKPFEVVPPERAEIVKKYPHQIGFFEDLPLIEDSQEILAELAQKHEVFFTSAAMEFKYSFLEKYHWIEAHFPFIHWKNRVFCGDKSIIRADYMIDDNGFNLDTFQGEGLLFTAPHNLHMQKYRRVNSWKEIKEIFEAL